MKYAYMNTEKILNQFHYERNHTLNSMKIYRRAINVFEKYSCKPLNAILTIAEDEENRNIHWKNSTLKPLLIGFRKYLYDTYKERTADSYLTCTISVLRHYDITVPKLPYFSKTNINTSEPIYAEDLPNRKILQLAMMINNPFLRAVTSFMSSTGISRIDTLNLTIGDWLEATKDYHKSDNILDAILEMNDSPIDVIPTFYLTRQKTNMDYFTFASAESVVHVNSYLWSREDKLTDDSVLFKIHDRYFNDLFQKTNDMLKLGRVNNISRFSPQMLRRYHATQLMEAGWPTDKINVLQGRKNHDIANVSYIRYKPSKLKEEYISALPFLVIEPYERIRTELDITKEQLEVANSENIKLQNDINNIWDELNNVKSRQDAWETFKNRGE